MPQSNHCWFISHCVFIGKAATMRYRVDVPVLAWNQQAPRHRPWPQSPDC